MMDEGGRGKEEDCYYWGTLLLYSYEQRVLIHETKYDKWFIPMLGSECRC